MFAMRITTLVVCTLCWITSYGLPAGAWAAEDILIADFEGDTYAPWKVEGEAFGSGPAQGTLPGQMDVRGFEGKRLVNSFLQGDRTTGKLTSPTFTIQRPWINFLIGGGQHQDQLVIKLLINGESVHTSSGPNNTAGGSEALDWDSWDVAKYVGQKGTIEILDQATGGWGHINVDQIVQSDQRRSVEPAARTLEITQRYLHLPVKNGAPKRRMKFTVAGQVVRDFEIEYAEAAADYVTLADVSAFQGKTLTVHVDKLPGGPAALMPITPSNEKPAAAEIYHEKLRPQFHFTSQRGWLNDPNGLVYANGKYHLFYQHNPYGWGWGNMHWGHAVSADLFHWEEMPESVYPAKFGDWAFSGSAVVDPANTTGFGEKRDGIETIIAAFTSTGRGECILTSRDNGLTWTELPENPVVKHQGRDPKLLWHAPTKKWVMALYDEFEGKQWITFHTSIDMRKWEFASRIEGYFECPDLFETKIQGTAEKRWVLYGADGKYATGQFDGKTFIPDGPKQQLWYGNFYAAQTYSNDPQGRIIQIGWGRDINFPGMPFNQQMVVPVELTLHKREGRIVMHAQPARELDGLRGNSRQTVSLSVSGGGSSSVSLVNSVPSRWKLDLQLNDARIVKLNMKGVPVVVDREKGLLTCHQMSAPIDVHEGKLSMEVLLDRGSMELFVNQGQSAFSIGGDVTSSPSTIEITADQDQVELSAEGHLLESIWKK
ncbi:MAG: 2,6-beta-D-fructofuranosidase [Planctomycetota bacterium]|nr:MAG: 2,6-beta-D-fructofuranosidase [Planctomycetota bacterium]